MVSTACSEGFWELQSKNIWRPKVGNHCPKVKPETEHLKLILHTIVSILELVLTKIAWPQHLAKMFWGTVLFLLCPHCSVLLACS